MRTSGQVAIRATALEPFHHGAGVSGNTQKLRMQEMINPATGEDYRAPFFSGNAMKHRIRYHAVEYAIHVLGLEDGVLTGAEVDLLTSGGHLKKTIKKTAITLEKARRLEELFPALSMCAYSAGNTMTSSKLTVSHLHLVCSENRWRMPEDLHDTPMANRRVRTLTTKEFGTRHDQKMSQFAMRYMDASEQKLLAEKKSKALAKRGKDKEDKGDSAQMIYDFQVVKTGGQFWGTIWFNELTDLELAAFRSAFYYGSKGEQNGKVLAHLAAKSSVGFGLMELELRGSVRATAAEYRESKLLEADNEGHRSSMDKYHQHLLDNRREIFDAIREAVS